MDRLKMRSLSCIIWKIRLNGIWMLTSSFMGQEMHIQLLLINILLKRSWKCKQYLSFIGVLKEKKRKRLLYVSSGEIYGRSDDAKRIFEENFSGYLDITSTRSCYPLSKRMTENLCVSYAKEYGLETVIVRPCHIWSLYNIK